jgi:hypothetical protein
MTNDEHRLSRQHALCRLAQKGVVAHMFYHEQTWGTGLLSWFADGPVIHNVAGVVESLRTRWQPSAAAPLVLAALSELLFAHAREDEAPELFTEVARIALWCGDPEQATTFARETLRRVGDAPSVLRCKALRTLGVALVSQGQTTEGLFILDDAIAAAALIGAPVEGASAQCQAGLHALTHQDYPRAGYHGNDSHVTWRDARRAGPSRSTRCKVGCEGRPTAGQRRGS